MFTATLLLLLGGELNYTPIFYWAYMVSGEGHLVHEYIKEKGNEEKQKLLLITFQVQMYIAPYSSPFHYSWALVSL